MPLTLANGEIRNWTVRKIGVVGPGIVGMPMAALLADAHIRVGTEEPAGVTIVQRDSPTSGWKVDAINAGRCPIQGVEPELDIIVQRTVKDGLLRGTHDPEELRDADVVLICAQTDKKGFAPDYGPLFAALESLADALKEKPADNIPLIIFESTLAPSTLGTSIREYFEAHDFRDGQDILLGFSPNRVMPGRLVERVRSSDKLVSGLLPITPSLIETIYSRIVTQGTLLKTNALTAEIVKTTENAYRDVRIALTSEVAHHCDLYNIDFFQLREAANHKLHQADGASFSSSAIPSGGFLIPTIGVGGHCLPKDGILLLWRRLESHENGHPSQILQARRINDDSPRRVIRLAEKLVGSLHRRQIALLGAAYRGNSEDTRNSPSLTLAKLLLEMGARVTIHDPYVRPDDQNLTKFGLHGYFSRSLSDTLRNADILIACTPHDAYRTELDRLIGLAPSLKGVLDGCNLWSQSEIDARLPYAGIGRGAQAPSPGLVDYVIRAFRVVEKAFAREVYETVAFLNRRYADSEFSRVDFREVKRLAATCPTGCQLTDEFEIEHLEPAHGFVLTLVEQANSETTGEHDADEHANLAVSRLDLVR